MSLIFVNKILSKLNYYFSSHVPLYHATYEKIPENLKKNIHNVQPDIIYKQLVWYKKHFDVVSLDEFLNDWKIGRVSITFDDGYLSIFENVLPILEELKIPITIFLNGVSLNGEMIWRDKVRYLINNNLTADFIKYLKGSNYRHASSFNESNFYKISKDININSKEFDKLMKSYFCKNGIGFDNLQYTMTYNDLVESPYITYGNHSFSHYLLSSLTYEEQLGEILKNHIYLGGMGLKTSKVFSVPFGGYKSFNNKTLEILRELGYKGVLLSRNKINKAKPLMDDRKDIKIVERYMVEPDIVNFHRHLINLEVKLILSNFS